MEDQPTKRRKNPKKSKLWAPPISKPLSDLKDKETPSYIKAYERRNSPASTNHSTRTFSMTSRSESKVALLFAEPGEKHCLHAMVAGDKAPPVISR